MNKPLGPAEETDRGFQIIRFTDLYGAACCLQESSLVTSTAVWLGINEIKPKVMHLDAASVGVKTDAREGWVDYPIPEKVHVQTRMHLNREQVEALIATLQNWLETGSFDSTPVPSSPES